MLEDWHCTIHTLVTLTILLFRNICLIDIASIRLNIQRALILAGCSMNLLAVVVTPCSSLLHVEEIYSSTFREQCNVIVGVIFGYSV